MRPPKSAQWIGVTLVAFLAARTAAHAAPVANPQSVTTAFNTATVITLTATDTADNNPQFTFSIVTDPTHGTLSGNGRNVTYRPDPGYAGPDSFTFRARNNNQNSSPATVSITVGLPAPPTANPQSVTTALNTPKAITLTASDPNSLPLTYSIVDSPTHGTLSGTAPNVTYTPAGGYTGPDSFTFTVNNGFEDSSPATVSITVNLPAPPTANPQSVATAFNTARAITLIGTDPAGLPLVYSIATGPTHGTISGTAPNLTYTPAGGYTGPDSFTFTVNNGFLDSSPAAVAITVNLPGAPTANPQSVATAFNTARAITLIGTDPAGLPLVYSIATGPTHGTISGTAPNVTYTPAGGYTGPDSFTFTVNNGFLDSSPAAVAITVNLPGAPTANPQSVVTAFNTARAITLTGTDPNNLPLTYAIVANPTRGTLSGTAPNVTYTPAGNFTGADSFTFRVNDGLQNSNSAAVSITVNLPGAPAANPQSVTTAFGAAKAITLTGTDPNSLPLTYAIVGSPAHGTLSGTAPNITYSPATGYAGPDSFTFRVNNGSQNSGNAAVSITVAPAAPPVLVPPVINIPGPLTLADVITITPAPGVIADSYNWSFIPLATPGNTGSPAGLISRTQASTQLSLGALGLSVGTYQVRVHAVSGQASSADAVATLTIVSPIASTIDGVRVYPNPWRSDLDSDLLITFDRLTPGATIKIFDMAAHWVRTLSATATSVTWDRRNDSGDLVASGMYLYLATDNHGGQTRGKLTIIK